MILKRGIMLNDEEKHLVFEDGTCFEGKSLVEAWKLRES